MQKHLKDASLTSEQEGLEHLLFYILLSSALWKVRYKEIFQFRNTKKIYIII